MNKRIIEITFNNRKEGFVFPINPKTIELSEGNQNEKINLLELGEINLIGKRNLVTFTLSSFFPNENSPHYNKATMPPSEYINLLKKWKNSGKPVRVIISNPEVNLAMAIERITEVVNEGDGDIYFTLELAEYRFLNVTPIATDDKKVENNGLKDRPNTKGKPTTYTVKKGDSLWTISKRVYGDGAKYTDIYKKNKTKIDSKNKGKKDKYAVYVGQVLSL